MVMIVNVLEWDSVCICLLIKNVSSFILVHSFRAFLHSFLSLLADVLFLPPDLHSYEFESGGLVSSGQSMGRLRQSIGFWESIKESDRYCI